MLDTVPDEYEIDPGTDIERLAEIFLREYPDAVYRPVDDAFFADGGPIDYLTWVALEDHTRYEISYHDADPDAETLRRLLSLSPDREEMRQFQAYLSSEFETVEPLEHITFLSVPDKYLPGTKPQANVMFYQNPLGNEVNIGLTATPLQQEEEIFADVDRLVPAKDLQTFSQNVVYEFYDELEQTAEDHLLEGEVSSLLESDSDFRYQTSKPLPDGIFPSYTGEMVELWQKPVSKEPAIDGAQGFVQIWVPDEGAVGFVSLTDGDYNPREALDSVRTRLETALD